MLKVRAALKEQLDLEVTTTSLFRYPTIRSLVEFLDAESGRHNSAAQLEVPKNRRSDNIAIIGMNIRVPGAEDVDQFWQNLLDGNEGITFFSDEELLSAGITEAALNDDGYVRARGILRDIENFDAEFFDYSARDAEILDPQHRLFLEGAWHTFEHAGYDPATILGQVGVYAGTGMNRYAQLNLSGQSRYHGPVGEFQKMIGNDKDFLSSRVAYKLDLHGPAITVQTACSTSLVAIHLACEALRNGDCDVALAGGVSVDIPELAGYQYQEGMIVSDDGHCRPFDAKANGTVFASGVAIVLLKPLQTAIDDGDNIQAVIKGSAINNDGSGKIGYTAPSVDGQIDVISRAQKAACVSAESIGYIEAHGTATSLGDPIEVLALSQAFARSTQATAYCGLGALKSNIGHTDAAAGAAGLIKTALALKNKKLPPTLHFHNVNPEIDLKNSPFYVVDRLMGWPESIEPLRAGVSSFGIGGTNAHVILEDYVRSTQQSGISEDGKRDTQLLCLSARTEPALREMAARYAIWLSGGVEVLNLADVCYTANTGRARFSERLFVVDRTVESLSQRLQQYAESGKSRGLVVGGSEAAGRPRVAFLFTGQGSQWLGMGKDLYETQPVFREELRRCEALLRDDLEQPLSSVMFGGEGMEGLLDETRYTQPALFALEWSLAKLWQSWGIEPTLVMGHSVGEYVAACLSGVFSLEDGLRLIAARGRLMQQQPPDGSMVAVMASEARVRAAVSGYEADVSVAGVNGPSSIVVSGRRDKVEECLQGLREEGVKLNELVVSHAFHSPLMDPMLDEFEAVARGVRYSAPRLMLVSNVSGALAGEEVCSARYWREHVREAVNFVAGMRTLEAQGVTTYVEVGPSPVLLGMGRACVEEDTAQWVNSLRRNESGCSQMQAALGQLWLDGHKVQWSGYEAGQRRHRVAAPTYPFQRKRFWVEPVKKTSDQYSATGAATLAGRKLNLPGSSDIRFETRFSSDWPPYVPDHRIFGTLVVAGASHVSMFLETATRALRSGSVQLTELFFLNPFVLAEKGQRDAQVVFKQTLDSSYSFELLSAQVPSDDNIEEEWVRHAEGQLSVDLPSESIGRPDSISTIQQRCPTVVSGVDFYRDEWVQGDDAGPSFRWFDQLWRGDEEALASIQVPELDDTPEEYALHPGLIEACFQVMRGGYTFESQSMLAEGGDIYVPFRIERCCYFGRDNLEKLWCYGKIQPGATQERVVADLSLFTASGRVIASIDGFEVRRLPRESLLRSLNLDGSAWMYETRYIPTPSPTAMVDSRSDDKRWIVFTDHTGVGSCLCSELAARGYQVTTVDHSESADNHTSTVIDPSDPLSYQRVLSQCQEQKQSIAGVVHLWSLDEFSPYGITTESRNQKLCSNSLLLLMQAMVAKLDDAVRCHLVVITRAAQTTTLGEQTIDPWSTSMWGLARVFALEHPNFVCKTIDLDSAFDANEPDLLVEELVSTDTETHVCLHSGVRSVGRLQRIDACAQRVLHAGDVPVRSDGAYLVSGGVRGLGFEVAKWICSCDPGEIILVGRSNPNQATRAEIANIVSSDTKITFWAVDVSDENGVNSLVSQRGRAALPIRGVVHAAGVIDDGLIIGQTVERLNAVLGPKVQGTLNLASLVDEYESDFFLLFSSATSVLGAGGQATYGAANAFIDGFAQARQQLGLCGHAVNWGPWAEVGMAARMSGRDLRRLQEAGIERVGLSHGLEIFGNLLKKAQGQTALLPIDWVRYLRVAGHEVLNPFLSDIAVTCSNVADTKVVETRINRIADLDALSTSDRIDRLTLFVSQHVAELLGSDQLGESDKTLGFVDLGLDSLMSVELRRRLQLETGLKLSTTFAFDYPNVVMAAEHLNEKLIPVEKSGTADSIKTLSGTSLEPDEKTTNKVTETIDSQSIEAELARLESRLGKNEGVLP